MNELLQNNKELTFARATFSDRLMATAGDDICFTAPLHFIRSFLITVIIPLYILGHRVTLYEPFVLVAYFGYYCYYAYLNHGQTLGKMWFRIRIVRLDGGDLSIMHLAVRCIVKDGFLVIGLLFSKWGGLIWLATYLLALTKDRMALHDIIARTQVIKVEQVAHQYDKGI